MEALVGNRTAAKVLMYLHVYREGYPSGIAHHYNIPLNMVQKQLARFEDGGMLVSRLQGRTRVYSWNPRYPFQEQLDQLLARYYEYLPREEKQKWYRRRTRPRRKGKEL